MTETSRLTPGCVARHTGPRWSTASARAGGSRERPAADRRIECGVATKDASFVFAELAGRLEAEILHQQVAERYGTKRGQCDVRTGRALSSAPTAALPGTGTQQIATSSRGQPRGGCRDRGALSGQGARWRLRNAHSNGSLPQRPRTMRKLLVWRATVRVPRPVRVHRRRDPTPRRRYTLHRRRSAPRTPTHRSVSRPDESVAGLVADDHPWITTRSADRCS